MGYHYGLECRKFQVKWDKLHREYAMAGMSEAAIQEMRDFDWKELKRERIFRIHNQSLECSFADDETASEYNSPLINKQLEHLSVKQPEICEWNRLDWIEDIDTPEIVQQIKTLSKVDLEILSYMIVDGLSRAEISRELNVSRAAITKRLNRIKTVLEKVCFIG